jgi:Flp pilus assembly protein TadD
MSSALSALQLATDAVEDARKRLERAKADVDDDYEIRQALKHLEDATGYIRKATSELKQQG